ncbi:MAG TPA: hypothetical protein EYN91_15005 [Candidatus Melainabacteria bacterium]|nr:hypothetical protein [Candidatus Melainabacteria bacterium]
MCLPLIVLAVCAALAGMVFDWSWLQSVQMNYFANYLLTTPSLAHETARATQLPGSFHVNIAVLSTCVALAGVGLGACLYLGRQSVVKWLGSRLSRIGFYQLSWNKFYIDEIYDWCIVWPLRGCAALSYFVDRWIVDGMVNLVGRLPVYLGSTMRSLQLGFIPFYALAMVLGLLILIASQMMWAEG